MKKYKKYKNDMKVYIIVGVLLFVFSCKKQIKKEKGVELVTVSEKNNCLVGDNIKLEDSQLRINFENFNLVFSNVKSMDDDPNTDFDIIKKGTTIHINRKFLESDFLGDNEFIIESSLLDSINISCLIKKDFVFYGEEKKRKFLDFVKIKRERINCNKGVYEISSSSLEFNSDVVNSAKRINKAYWLNILSSDSYGELDKVEAREKLKKIKSNIEMSYEELFVEELILLTTYTFECYKGKTKFQKKLIISNRFK